MKIRETYPLLGKKEKKKWRKIRAYEIKPFGKFKSFCC
jgi:hypothetical protein